MNAGAAAKIRLVRCPKCRKFLPEMPNIPVYQCGGCGTTLQAKIRKQNSQSTTSSLCETLVEETRNAGHVSEGKEFSSSSYGTSLQCAGECSSDQNNLSDHVESGNCNGDDPKGKKKLSEDENDASDQNGSDDNFSGGKLEDNLSSDSQKIASDNGKAGLRDNKHFKGANLSDEDCKNGSHQNDSLIGDIELHGVADGDCLSNEIARIENLEPPQSLLVGMNSEAEENDEAKVKAEADANSEIGSTLERLNQGKLVDPRGSTSNIATHRPESISSDILLSSPNELLEEPQETAHHEFDCVRSTDTFDVDTIDIVNPSSELSGTLIDLSKSPTTRSSRAYYDDGVSSYEGTDDQLPNRHKHTSKHAYRVANHAVSDVRSRRERFPISSNYDMQQNFENSTPDLSERTHYPSKYSSLDQDEVLESTRLGHPGRLWRNIDRDEYQSQHAFHTRKSMAEYEIGSSSNQHPQPAYNYQEKLKLLRMIYELQDELKTSMNDKANGRVSWQDHQILKCYDHEVEPEESFHNLVHPRYSSRVRDESNWPQQRKYSRIPFSAEATINSHQVDHSLCCCPKDRKWSAQVPPPGLCHNKGFCRVHSPTSLYNPYGSCPSSPQHHVDFEYPMYIRGTKSDDQRHRDFEIRKHLREKYHLPKRHLRPLSGGAPFVTCPCCWKVLQLPADFILFKRRCHRLKCSACSELLKFSLVNNTHLIPYTPVAEAHPLSEVDEHSDGIHGRNFTSTSRVTDCPSISCSDDCEPVAPVNSFERKVSYDSLEHDKERERFLNGTPSKGKSLVDKNESASSSKSKTASSEIEEVPAAGRRRGGSPLHQLMGYSSAWQVMYGTGQAEWDLSE